MFELMTLLFINKVEYKAPVTPQISAIEAPRVVPEESLETAFKRVFGRDWRIMSAISFCESSHRQFDKNGEPLQGIVDPEDTGLYQINKHYHLESAQKLGYDIDTSEGNMMYAKYLLNKNGLKDWNASKPCWSRIIDI